MAIDLYNIPLTRIDGTQASLAEYAGKVLLLVNTASKCGLTPQYEGLEALYTKYKGEGFVVLGFPSNNFAGQEPGDDTEIKSFCSTSYSIDFPMFSKISVAGDDKHPLYSALIQAQPKAYSSEAFRERLKGYGMTPNPEPEVLWNFEKFLIGRDGSVIARFAPDSEPLDEAIVRAVEAALSTQ